MKQKRNAFTLVEFLVTLAIAAAAAAIVIPALVHANDNRKSKDAFNEISRIGLVEAKKLYEKNYIEWGIEKGKFTDEQTYDEQERYLSYTAMSVFTKILSEGYESLSEEEKRILITGWFRKEEIESRQAEYLKRENFKLEWNIGKLLEEKALLETQEPNIP